MAPLCTGSLALGRAPVLTDAGHADVDTQLEQPSMMRGAPHSGCHGSSCESVDEFPPQYLDDRDAYDA
jgi:hypothetical protein